MLTYKKGDLLREETEALVNTVNCVGVMGRGIALQFKKTFPGNFVAYAAACQRKEVQPGKMFVHETGQLTWPRYIINFPTKRHWRGKSRIEDIESGLEALVEVVRERGIRSIAIPPLGSGLGGLDWRQVKPLIARALEAIPELKVLVYEPGGAGDNQRSKASREIPKMTAGRAALVALIHRYREGLMDPFVTLLEIHKLMYFLQAAGEPLRLDFQKGLYGPYAQNLRHVLNAIEGHLTSGYADGGDDPKKHIELVPGALVDVRQFLADHQQTHARLRKVSQLVEGFESPFGLELLATVHWVQQQTPTTDLDALVDHIYAWNDRKKQFSRQQIHIASQVLNAQGWNQTLSL